MSENMTYCEEFDSKVTYQQKNNFKIIVINVSHVWNEYGNENG